MTEQEARALFLEHCQPGDMSHYGEKAAVAAILAVTAHIEAEARRVASHYQAHSDGWNTFLIFADLVDCLTAEGVARHAEAQS